MGGSPAWGLSEVLTIPHRKKINHVTKYCKKPRNRTDPSVRPKEWIDLPQHRDRWGTLVKAVMNLRGP
jgi:hypothetical protein